MMSELYLCVQGFFFFYEHGCVDPHPSPTAPHAHLHLHLLLRIYKQDIATKNLHSRSIDATASSPASLCTMSESRRQTYVNADSPTHALTLTSQWKKKRHMCNMPKEWNGYADDTCIHKHSFLLTLRSKVTKKGSSLRCLVQKQD